MKTRKIKHKFKDYSRKIGGMTGDESGAGAAGATSNTLAVWKPSTPSPTSASSKPASSKPVRQPVLSEKFNDIKTQLVTAFNEASPEALRKNLFTQLEKMVGKKLTLKVSENQGINKTRKTMSINDELSRFINKIDTNQIKGTIIEFIRQYLKALINNKRLPLYQVERLTLDKITHLKTIAYQTQTDTENKSSILFNRYLRKMLATIEYDIREGVDQSQQLKGELDNLSRKADEANDAANTNPSSETYREAAKVAEDLLNKMNEIIKRTRGTHGGANLSLPDPKIVLEVDNTCFDAAKAAVETTKTELLDMIETESNIAKATPLLEKLKQNVIVAKDCYDKIQKSRENSQRSTGTSGANNTQSKRLPLATGSAPKPSSKQNNSAKPAMPVINGDNTNNKQPKTKREELELKGEAAPKEPLIGETVNESNPAALAEAPAAAPKEPLLGETVNESNPAALAVAAPAAPQSKGPLEGNIKPLGTEKVRPPRDASPELEASRETNLNRFDKQREIIRDIYTKLKTQTEGTPEYAETSELLKSEQATLTQMKKTTKK